MIVESLDGRLFAVVVVVVAVVAVQRTILTVANGVVDLTCLFNGRLIMVVPGGCTAPAPPCGGGGGGFVLDVCRFASLSSDSRLAIEQLGASCALLAG